MIGEEQNLASTDKNSLDLGSHQRICAKFIIGSCLEQSQIVDNNRSKVQSTIQDIRIEAVNKLIFENLLFSENKCLITSYDCSIIYLTNDENTLIYILDLESTRIFIRRVRRRRGTRRARLGNETSNYN